jgi:putative hemolysin
VFGTHNLIERNAYSSKSNVFRIRRNETAGITAASKQGGFMPVYSPIPQPFRIDSAHFGARTAERLLALPALNDLYERISRSNAGRSTFAERALAEMGIDLGISPIDLNHIPRNGPLVVVANHPFGGVDGLALAALVQRVRPDVKLLANEMLSCIPELRDTLLPVNAFGDAEAENLRSMRAAIRWVKDGGVLCVFPAGEVSHFTMASRTVADGAWNPVSARLAQITGAAVLPIFFEGRNSAFFQLAGLIHPRLRTALLPRELLRHHDTRIRLHIGTVVPAERLAKFRGPVEATAYLRLRCHILSGRVSDRVRPRRAQKRSAGLTAVAAPQSVDLLKAEVASLPSDRLLVAAKDLRAFLVAAGDAPAILREIGRLREVTFRQVGEGTGKSLDLDRFDRHYRHLFVWNEKSHEIVGAYRLGLTDEILPRFGAEGLYTNTLFRFRGTLLDQINPAIELGRSFVREEYQKEYLPLMLLWKGIGRFVAREPRYRNLIGPVSISSDYASLTKQILMSFLQCNNRLASLASLIVPRNPPQFGPPRDSAAAVVGHAVQSIEEVDELVAEIEQDRRRVPVLLRQYLKLGAKLLGFNVDPDFGDVLDGLMLVDLLKVEPAVLGRYMGTENLAAFRAYHTSS